MSRSVPKFERLAESIARRRNDVAAEVLFAAASGERSIGAHLFVDAFLDRFVAAGKDGDIAAFSAWLAATVSPGNPMRPPANVAKAIVPVLQAISADNSLSPERLVALSAVAPVLSCVTEDVQVEAEPSLDETDAAIGKVMRTLDERDPLTAEHSRAVASWCGRIARRLNLSDALVIDSSRSGMVHDIGKLRVPLHILRAPRALSGDEWDMMRAHVDFGDQMAIAEESLHAFRAGIRYHHERLGGGGYPYGIKGDAIPLMARIVCVADAFNAMIGRRPYRPPILPSMALFELQRSCGTQFDPDIVHALEAVITRTGH